MDVRNRFKIYEIIDTEIIFTYVRPNVKKNDIRIFRVVNISKNVNVYNG